MKNFLRSFAVTVLLVAAAGIAKGHALYWDFGVEEIPMFLIGMDKDARGFYSFFNILNAEASLNLEDNFGIRGRLKYTFFGMTNVNTSNQNNQHHIYPDRLNVYYNSDFISVLAGRDIFLENNGLVIGNLADGLKLQFNFLGMKEKLFVYYSGLLPADLNQFSADIMDMTNGLGASRLSAGLVLQKMGLLTRSLSLLGLFSMDMTTNRMFNPFYLALYADGSIIPRLTYNVTAAMELGSVTNGNNIFGWGGDATLIYVFEDPFKFGFTGEFAIASGDSTGTTNTFEGFNTFGRFNTGYVLYPDFSNLMFFRLGGFVKLLDDHLGISLNYYFMTRLSTNDTVNGFYDGTNAMVGNEFSGSVNYEFDPNFSVFLSAGYLFGNQSITNKPSIYKLAAGAAVKF